MLESCEALIIVLQDKNRPEVKATSTVDTGLGSYQRSISCWFNWSFIDRGLLFSLVLLANMFSLLGSCAKWILLVRDINWILNLLYT